MLRTIAGHGYMAGQSSQETRRAMDTHDRYTMVDLKPGAAPLAGRPSIRTIQIVRAYDSTPDLRYLKQRYTKESPADATKYRAQDRARLAAYDAGQWYMLGIYAQATIAVPLGQNCACVQTIKSPGLWGIESDSDAAHFDETGQEELEQLRTILAALNVDLDAWPAVISTRGE